MPQEADHDHHRHHTTAPAWLNLDAIAPPELRDRLAQTACEGMDLLPVIKPWCDTARALIDEWAAATGGQDFPDGAYRMVEELTGAKALIDTAYWLGAHLTGVVDRGDPTAAYLDELEAKFGEVDK